MSALPPLLPDDLVAERMIEAFGMARKAPVARDDILEAFDEVADEIEQSVRAAVRVGGRICLRKIRRVVCLRTAVARAKEKH